MRESVRGKNKWESESWVYKEVWRECEGGRRNVESKESDKARLLEWEREKGEYEGEWIGVGYIEDQGIYGEGGWVNE